MDFDAIDIIRAPIPKMRVAAHPGRLGDLVKAVVDLKRTVMAIGGGLHADLEALLLEDGSKQSDLWGINLYPEKTGDDFIEFDSMINIRPKQDNRSRCVEDADRRTQIVAVVKQLITE